MNTIGIIQARMASTRLPGKVLLPLAGRPLLWHIADRCGRATRLDGIVVATTTNPADDILSDWCGFEGIPCFRGDENNVLKRFYDTAVHFGASRIVRITADDPFKQPDLIDMAIEACASGNYDFVCNNHPPTFAEGLDTEAFTMSALKQAYLDAKDPFELEHCTQYFHRNPDLFRTKNLTNTSNESHLRWTIDTPADFRFAAAVYAALYKPWRMFDARDIKAFLLDHPEVAGINANEQRSLHYQQTDTQP